MKIKPLMALLVALALAACATNNSSLYYWGNYESILYDMYHKPGQATPELQIMQLNANIEQAQNQQKRVPPGVFAHLGTMYAAAGNLGDALASFERERQLYPESKTLVDGMIARAQGEAE